MYSFLSWEPVHCSMSSSYCCLVTCIQISQETGKVVWYSHLLKNFPRFVVIHTVKGFGIVNKAEIDVFFWNSLAFSMIQQMLPIWSLIPLPFLNPTWTSASSRFTYCWSLAWRILSITLASMWDECNCAVVLQEGGHLPGPETGLLSNTRKWIVWGDTRADKARDFIGKGHLGGEQ